MSEQNQDELQGTPLVTQDDLDRWEQQNNAVQLEGVTHNEQEDTSKEDKDEPKTGDGKDSQDDEEDEAAAVPEEFEPQVELDDPGDYQPADYSFEVTIYKGEEGKEKPKTVKITSVAQAEELLEDDPNFGSAKNLLDFNRKVTRMESNLERDKNDWENRKKEYEEAKEAAEEQAEYINTVAKELAYLEAEGLIEKVPAKYRNADWSNKEVAKEPTVKAQLDIINYMSKENHKRAQYGIRPMTAIDAFNALKSTTAVQEAQDRKKQEQQARKDAGSRIAPARPSPVTTVPKGVKVGRVNVLDNIDRLGF